VDKDELLRFKVIPATFEEFPVTFRYPTEQARGPSFSVARQGILASQTFEDTQLFRVSISVDEHLIMVPAEEKSRDVASRNRSAGRLPSNIRPFVYVVAQEDELVCLPWFDRIQQGVERLQVSMNVANRE
jgi:hypothetical protein